MARGLSIKMRAEACRSLAFGSIGAAYAGIGTVLANPARMIFLQNLTDATVWISLDGVNDHFPLLNQGYLLLDVSSNKTQDTGFFLAEGDRLYCKRLDTPTSGSVYFTSFYGV